MSDVKFVWVNEISAFANYLRNSFVILFSLLIKAVFDFLCYNYSLFLFFYINDCLIELKFYSITLLPLPLLPPAGTASKTFLSIRMTWCCQLSHCFLIRPCYDCLFDGRRFCAQWHYLRCIFNVKQIILTKVNKVFNLMQK